MWTSSLAPTDFSFWIFAVGCCNGVLKSRLTGTGSTGPAFWKYTKWKMSLLCGTVVLGSVRHENQVKRERQFRTLPAGSVYWHNPLVRLRLHLLQWLNCFLRKEVGRNSRLFTVIYSDRSEDIWVNVSWWIISTILARTNAVLHGSIQIWGQAVLTGMLPCLLLYLPGHLRQEVRLPHSARPSQSLELLQNSPPVASQTNLVTGGDSAVPIMSAVGGCWTEDCTTCTDPVLYCTRNWYLHVLIQIHRTI